MNVKQKIAIPSEAPGGLTAQGTTRFGRCAFFTLIQLENGEIQQVEIIKNDGHTLSGGSGPFAVQLLINHDVDIVVGGEYGPNAAKGLYQSEIPMYGTIMGKVQDIVNAYLHGEIPKIEDATVPELSGMDED